MGFCFVCIISGGKQDETNWCQVRMESGKDTKAETASVISGVALGGFALLQGTARTREHLRQKPSTGFTESNLRRIIVAKGIQNLAKQLDAEPGSTPKKLVLLYPPVHWKGIKEYLDDPKKVKPRIPYCIGIQSWGFKGIVFHHARV